MVFQRHKALAAIFLSLVSAPALAFEDTATGLKVNPPEPFLTEKTERPNQDVVAGVYSSTGVPVAATSGKYICEIAFKGAEQNAGLSKEDINTFIGGDEWQGVAKGMFEQVFAIQSSQEFTLDGFTGFEVIGTPKSGPDAENTRVVLSISETAKGRTTTSCSVTASELETALPQLYAIRDSITLPQ